MVFKNFVEKWVNSNQSNVYIYKYKIAEGIKTKVDLFIQILEISVLTNLDCECYCGRLATINLSKLELPEAVELLSKLLKKGERRGWTREKREARRQSISCTWPQKSTTCWARGSKAHTWVLSLLSF